MRVRVRRFTACWWHPLNTGYDGLVVTIAPHPTHGEQAHLDPFHGGIFYSLEACRPFSLESIKEVVSWNGWPGPDSRASRPTLVPEHAVQRLPSASSHREPPFEPRDQLEISVEDWRELTRQGLWKGARRLLVVAESRAWSRAVSFFGGLEGWWSTAGFSLAYRPPAPLLRFAVLELD